MYGFRACVEAHNVLLPLLPIGWICLGLLFLFCLAGVVLAEWVSFPRLFAADSELLLSLGLPVLLGCFYLIYGAIYSQSWPRCPWLNVGILGVCVVLYRLWTCVGVCCPTVGLGGSEFL